MPAKTRTITKVAWLHSKLLPAGRDASHAKQPWLVFTGHSFNTETTIWMNLRPYTQPKPAISTWFWLGIKNYNQPKLANFM